MVLLLEATNDSMQAMSSVQLHSHVDKACRKDSCSVTLALWLLATSSLIIILVFFFVVVIVD